MPAGPACHNTVQEYLPSAFAAFSEHNRYNGQRGYGSFGTSNRFNALNRYGTYKRETGEYEQAGNTYQQADGECSWHQMQNGRSVTVYPEEYRRWFTNITRHGSIGQPSNALTVIRPADGSHFVSDPRYRGAGVPIEITGGTEDTVHMSYDGRAPITLNRPFSGSLPLEKGEHRLIVRCGDDEVSVAFTVE